MRFESSSTIAVSARISKNYKGQIENLKLKQRAGLARCFARMIGEPRWNARRAMTLARTVMPFPRGCKSRFPAQLVFGFLALAAVNQAAPRKPWVEMDITLPTGETPRVIVREDEGALVRLPTGTRFGFVPSIRQGQDPPRVVVAIWDVDAQPNSRLGQVEAVVGGARVQSDTSPSFGLRVTRIVLRN